MWNGTIVSIHIALGAGQPMVAHDQVCAVAGQGLEGDRYFSGTGFYSFHTGPIREISLIEEETIETLWRDHKIQVAPGDIRRNLVTHGVPLNHLIDREFRVGEVRLRGVKLCEPCKHLVDVTGKRRLLKSLIHRGGLHAQILSDGILTTGDHVAEA